MGQDDLPHYQFSPSSAQHALTYTTTDSKQGPVCEHKCNISKGGLRRLWTTIAFLAITGIICGVLFFIQKPISAPVHKTVAGVAHRPVRPRGAVMGNGISSADFSSRAASTTGSITPSPLLSTFFATAVQDHGNLHRQVPMIALSKRVTVSNPTYTASSLDANGPESITSSITAIIRSPDTTTGSSNPLRLASRGHVPDNDSLPLSIASGRCTKSEHTSTDHFNLQASYPSAEQIKLHKTIKPPADEFVTIMSVSPSHTIQLSLATANTKPSSLATDISAWKNTQIQQGDCATSSHARKCLRQGFDCVDMGDGAGPLCMELRSDDGSNRNGAESNVSDRSRRNKLIGGIVGGVGGLLLLIAVLWALWRRKCHKHQRGEHNAAVAEGDVVHPVDPERATNRPAQ